MNVERKIQEKLLAAFAPAELAVQNDSHRHAHHLGAHGVPATGETHFTVTMVSDKFRGLSRLERHRIVNEVLAEELAGPVHALALKLSAPGE
jgi:BolA protein